MQITGLEHLVQVLLGSTALPILFSPQYHFFDGGVLLNQPISPALELVSSAALEAPPVDLDNFVLYVIIPSSQALGAVGNLLEIGSTVINSWLSLSLVAQIRNVRLWNGIRTLTGDKQLRICVIRPPLDLTKTFGVSLLDFGKKVGALVNDGEQAANDTDEYLLIWSLQRLGTNLGRHDRHASEFRLASSAPLGGVASIGWSADPSACKADGPAAGRREP